MKKCQKCGKDFPSYIVIEGKGHNLCNRKYCLECSPFGVGNTKQLHKEKKIVYCKLCGKESKHGRSLCNPCAIKVIRYKVKYQAAMHLGGKCAKCGRKVSINNLSIFDFHHLDPSEKEFTIGSNYNKSFEEIKSEIEKCELLCASCHRENHIDLNKEFIQYVSKYLGIN